MIITMSKKWAICKRIIYIVRSVTLFKTWGKSNSGSFINLDCDYEHEQSTTANMKLIAGRLPDYFINKWAGVSYPIREKRQNPGLEDHAKFVKRQAAIKNDPGFAGTVAMTTT